MGGVILTDPTDPQFVTGQNLILDQGDFTISNSLASPANYLTFSSDTSGNEEIDWLDPLGHVIGDLAFKSAFGNVRLESSAATSARQVSLVVVSDPTEIAGLCPLGTNQGCVEVDSDQTAFAFGTGPAALHGGGAQWRGNSSGEIWVGAPDARPDRTIFCCPLRLEQHPWQSWKIVEPRRLVPSPF